MRVRWNFDVAVSLAMRHGNQHLAWELIMYLTDGYTL